MIEVGDFMFSHGQFSGNGWRELSKASVSPAFVSIIGVISHDFYAELGIVAEKLANTTRLEE